MPLAVYREMDHPGGYLSTYCLHGVHEPCGSPEGVDANGRPFARRPAQCKLCAAPCICVCHNEAVST